MRWNIMWPKRAFCILNFDIEMDRTSALYVQWNVFLELGVNQPLMYGDRVISV